MAQVKVVDTPELEDFIGEPWFRVTFELAAQGYCSYVAPIDAEVIWTSDEECRDPNCVGRPFPVGMRRNDESYRAFGVCALCYRVVFEL